MGRHFGWWSSIPLSSLLASLILAPCTTNKMDPHVYPTRGPFFEGWYLRIIDPHQNISLGFMFGRVLPSTASSSDIENPCTVPSLQPLLTDCMKWTSKKQSHTNSLPLKFTNIRNPLIFVGILLSVGTQEKLYSTSGYFNSSQYFITKDGKQIVTNPDDESPPHFEARIDSNLSLVVRSSGTKFSVILGNHILQGETTNPIPWGPRGAGPESWLEYLPLPFHWFVYSLRSTVTSYLYVNKETGKVINGGSGQGVPVVAHIEKNWGRSFPKAWIWSEGVDPKSGISFVFSAGLVTVPGFDIKAQLSGYRNPSKQIDCSFNPSNSLHSLSFDGCAGTVVLEVEGITCAVTFHVSGTPKSFSSCLSAPMSDGFRKGCVESFTAVANITVYSRGFLSMVLIDNKIINFSALEFGGTYMCNGSCPVE